MMKKKGFTLIEIIVVLAILGVLMMLIVPSVSGYLQKSKEQVAKSNARQVVQTTQMEYALESIQGNMFNTSLLPPSDVLENIYKLSNAKGEILSVEADEKNDIVKLVYKENNITVSYCRDYITDSSCSALYNVGELHTNSLSSLWLKDENGKMIEFTVGGNLMDINRPNGTSIQGEIFYYDGDLMEHGYYIVRSGMTHLTNGKNIEKELKQDYGKGYFAKIDLDATVKTYKYNPNKAVNKGEIYLINFDWDDNPNPVLAMVSHWETGTDDNNWRGDLTGVGSKGTNANIWTILAEQK